MTPSAFVLLASQTRPFHYVMNILSTMEPVSDEYLDEEQDDNDLYNVRSLQSLIDIYCKIHKINYNIMFSISWDLILHHFFLQTPDMDEQTNRIVLIDGAPGSGMFFIF